MCWPTVPSLAAMKKPEQETANEGCICPDIKGGREEDMGDSGSGSQKPQGPARHTPGRTPGGECKGTTRTLCEKTQMIQHCPTPCRNKCHINQGRWARETVELRGEESEGGSVLADRPGIAF